MTKTLRHPRSRSGEHLSASDPTTVWLHCFASPLGWIAWQGTDRGVTALTLGQISREAAISALPAINVTATFPVWFAQAHKFLAAYCHGSPQDLSTIPLDRRDSTPFAESVIRSLLKMGYGETVSYLELAEIAGAPRAARAVGTVMSRNRVPLIIPCHRVIGSGGNLGGYSAPQGLTMKRLLLEMEQANRKSLSPELTTSR